MRLFAKRRANLPVESIPPIKYVSIFLKEAIRQGNAECVLRQSDELPTLAELLQDSETSDSPHVALPPLLGLVIAVALGVPANRIAWSALASKEMKEGNVTLMYMVMPRVSLLLVGAVATGIGFGLL